MGKGDKKTKRGKIFNKSYGVKRPRKGNKNSSKGMKQKSKNVSNGSTIHSPKTTPISNKINSTITAAKEKDIVDVSKSGGEKLTVAERGHQKKQLCYNCRKEFDTKDITKEHIPARNLFEGYDEKYKVNRITVPACSECNGKYSPTDKEFRNMIGVIAKRKENQKITEKAVKSILSTESGKQRLSINDLGKISGVSFGQTPIENFHKKNFKGLFYHQYGIVLPDNYELFVNIDESDWSDVTLGILGYLKDLFTWKHSGHPEILSYVIQPFRIGISNSSKEDLAPQKDENIFVGFLDYNKEHAALVLAVRKEYLEEIKNKKISK